MKLFIIAITLLPSKIIHASDTLYFRLSNAVNTIKDPNGQYLRKCVKESDYFHTWDYNALNVLVVESYFSDTNFTRKMYCQKYFNERKGYLEGSRCYENGRLNGYAYTYDEKGDTTGYDLYDQSVFIKSWRKKEEAPVYIFNDNNQSAQFPGGIKAWQDYLASNIIYPKSLLRENVHGKVILEVLISSNGSIESASILQSLHPLLDAEAVRVVKESPLWKPAKQNGKTVKYKMKQAINF